MGHLDVCGWVIVGNRPSIGQGGSESVVDQPKNGREMRQRGEFHHSHFVVHGYFKESRSTCIVTANIVEISIYVYSRSAALVAGYSFDAAFLLGCQVCC